MRETCIVANLHCQFYWFRITNRWGILLYVFVIVSREDSLGRETNTEHGWHQSSSLEHWQDKRKVSVMSCAFWPLSYELLCSARPSLCHWTDISETKSQSESFKLSLPCILWQLWESYLELACWQCLYISHGYKFNSRDDYWEQNKPINNQSSLSPPSF